MIKTSYFSGVKLKLKLRKMYHLKLLQIALGAFQTFESVSSYLLQPGNSLPRVNKIAESVSKCNGKYKLPQRHLPLLHGGRQ
jgi:hypothetical protein